MELHRDYWDFKGEQREVENVPGIQLAPGVKVTVAVYKAKLMREPITAGSLLRADDSIKQQLYRKVRWRYTGKILSIIYNSRGEARVAVLNA